MDNIEDFKRLCEVHCGNDEDKIKEMTELRRKIKNRVSQFFKSSSALCLNVFSSSVSSDYCIFVFLPFFSLFLSSPWFDPYSCHDGNHKNIWSSQCFPLLKPLQNKKGQKNLGYPKKKQSFFLIKGLLYFRVPQIFLALLILKRL